MGMGMQRWNGNGNDSMKVGRGLEQESHSRTPLFPIRDPDFLKESNNFGDQIRRR